MAKLAYCRTSCTVYFFSGSQERMELDGGFLRVPLIGLFDWAMSLTRSMAAAA